LSTENRWFPPDEPERVSLPENYALRHFVQELIVSGMSGPLPDTTPPEELVRYCVQVAEALDEWGVMLKAT
jgi:hypothetical protein